MKNFLLIVAVTIFLFSPTYAENIKKIEINGNKRVSDETIKIYGQIELNKEFTDLDLDRILKNLYETNFFEDVNIKVESNILKINLKEYPIVNQLVITGEKSQKYKEQINNQYS